VTPLDPQKLALTSPTGGGRSVGIVHSRTKATEFSFSFRCYMGSQQIRICIKVHLLNLKFLFFVAYLTLSVLSPF
jgi:hypothetical protein